MFCHYVSTKRGRGNATSLATIRKKKRDLWLLILSSFLRASRKPVKQYDGLQKVCNCFTVSLWHRVPLIDRTPTLLLHVMYVLQLSLYNVFKLNDSMPNKYNSLPFFLLFYCFLFVFLIFFNFFLFLWRFSKRKRKIVAIMLTFCWQIISEWMLWLFWHFWIMGCKRWIFLYFVTETRSLLKAPLVLHSRLCTRIDYVHATLRLAIAVNKLSCTIISVCKNGDHKVTNYFKKQIENKNQKLKL